MKDETTGPVDTLSGGWGDARLPELTARFGHPLNDDCEYASGCVVGALMNAEKEINAQAIEARRAFSEAWSEVTGEKVEPIDFTPEHLRHRLDIRFIERRSLADGAVPIVGLRVVTVRETAERWGLGHAHTDEVHEITGLLGGDTHLVECASQQIGVDMLQVAPPGSEVTCKSCRGWREQLAQMRIDGEVYTALRDSLALAEASLDTTHSEIAAMRAVTGPKCPKCGYYLKAEHARAVPGVDIDSERDYFYNFHRDKACGITVADLLANHPEIAREMGIA